MSKPTAAAMRAAKSINPRDSLSDRGLSLMIDSATGLPELIAACSMAHGALLAISSPFDSIAHDAIDQLFDALRIAKEGRS